MLKKARTARFCITLTLLNSVSGVMLRLNAVIKLRFHTGIVKSGKDVEISIKI